MISQKTPAFFRNDLQKFLINVGWQVIKTEGYLRVELSKEGNIFNLSAHEFMDFNRSQLPLLAGIIFSEMDNIVNRDQFLSRIHQYHEDMVAYNYQVELKVCDDDKKRKLMQLLILSRFESIGIRKTVYSVKIEKKEMNKTKNKIIILKGEIISLLFPENNPWIATVWGESDTMREKLLTFVKSLHTKTLIY
jgi:hypothetical protein